jgi:DNA-binding CsgD family transcriptional regulator
MICTLLIGFISFFTFYSQYIIFLRPETTVIRILDYLLWACFLFYWINYLDTLVNGSKLRFIKKIVNYGCLCYISIWLLVAGDLFEVNFEIANISGKFLFLLLDILFCILSLLVVCLFAIQGYPQAKSKLSSLYICGISFALIVYASWEVVHYARLFGGISTSQPWQLDPFNATAFFLLFTNLITLIYVYFNDFATILNMNQPAFKTDAPDSGIPQEQANSLTSEEPAATFDTARAKELTATFDTARAKELTATFDTACAKELTATFDKAKELTVTFDAVAAEPESSCEQFTVSTEKGANNSEKGASNSEKSACSSEKDTPCEVELVSTQYNLTPREKEVMEFVCKGYNNAEIADELFISQNTVKHHIYNLFRKLDVKNRVELICFLREYPT